MRAVVLAALVLASLGADAVAQTWSYLDCAASRIVVPDDFYCRTTSPYAATMAIAGGNGGGAFQAWTAAGTTGKARLYYILTASVGTSGGVRPIALAEDILKLPSAKRSTGMSDLVRRGDADTVTFKSAANQSCIGIRKVGPSSLTAYRWVLQATSCLPAGQVASDADIDAFIREARVRN
ncbi:MAG TPA: hypothetical protein VGM96_06885 [Reyranella sp.]|jgi:hypothetical protein